MSQFSSTGRTGIQVGDLLRARCQRWRVTRVVAYESCAIVVLSGIGPDNTGTERAFLAPFEPLEPIVHRPRVRTVRAGAWRRTCRTLIALDGPSDALHTAAAARIEVLPYQLEPVTAIVRGEASRVLIADEVGLGKTVQAALVVSELRARQAAARVLVVTPAGLREQWCDELTRRFELPAVIVDMRTAQQRLAIGAIGANPWTGSPVIVTSLDYVKRADVFVAASQERWDVVVVDEAHHVMAGTDRHQAVAALCAQAAFVLLLTATPHSGDQSAFDALRALGHQDDPLLVFRRTRQVLGLGRSRRIHRLRVRATADERRMHARLTRFVTAVSRDHAGTDLALAISTLQKRAHSSAFALEQTVRRRLSALGNCPESSGAQVPLPFDDPAGELDADDEAPAWTVPALHDSDRERRLLTDLADSARLAAASEGKLLALARLLRRIREPAIVFTEYRDTLIQVHQRIAPDAAIVHGGLSAVERRRELERFGAGHLLLTTDAAGEGLNLQRRCRVVINLELPWNPMRLEQRIGRVDRLGQTRTVHVFHLIASGGGEERLLERLAEKLTSAETTIGAPDPLGMMTDVRLKPDATRTPDTGGGAVLADATAGGEHARLQRVRALSPLDARAIAPGEVLAARAGNRRTRARLGSHSLLILRTTLSDETGRHVATRLTGAAINLAPQGWRSVNALESIASHIDDAAMDAWLEESRTRHQAFWSRRVAREQAIAMMLNTPAAPRQAGLFDRRALQALATDSLRQSQVQADCQQRVDAARRAAHLVERRLEPVLLLRP